jgi:hypothetical protein
MRPERIGDYRDLTRAGPHLSLVFHSGGFPVRWQQCSPTAEFVARSITDLLAGPSPDDSARSRISYIVNELLENAVKFSMGEVIEVMVGLEDDELVAVVTNEILAGAAAGVQTKLRALLSDDPQALMFARLQANALNPDPSTSGLGFLTIMADCEATLGWHLGPVEHDPRNVRLKTMARLRLRMP